jgi:hypothetical protein
MKPHADMRMRMVLSAVTLLFIGGTAMLWAQTSARQGVDGSMSELVREIRALRESVERSSLVTAQSQLVLGRLQLQEGRLAALGRQLTEARQHVQQAVEREGEVTREIDRFNADMEGASAEHRAEMTAMVASLRRQLKDRQALTMQRRADEHAAAAALAEEQNRWVDFNSRLEALERTISSAAAATRARE